MVGVGRVMEDRAYGCDRRWSLGVAHGVSLPLARETCVTSARARDLWKRVTHMLKRVTHSTALRLVPRVVGS
jgi:hypothetical protein